MVCYDFGSAQVKQMASLKKKLLPWVPRDSPRVNGFPRMGPEGPPRKCRAPPGGAQATPGLLNFAKNAPGTLPGSDLVIFEKRCITNIKQHILRVVDSKTQKANVPHPLWAPQGGPGEAQDPLTPPSRFPLVPSGLPSTSCFFKVRSMDPPEIPPWRKYT